MISVIIKYFSFIIHKFQQSLPINPAFLFTSFIKKKRKKSNDWRNEEKKG